MNKFAVILGVAVAATVVGCKDPDYNSRRVRPQNEVKEVEVKPAAKPVSPVVIVQTKTCKCPKGTKHTSPCKCGAPDCACVVVAPAPVKPVKAPEPEYTVYTVQRGDYLAKISKRYNVKVDAIRKLNPKIKKDIIWVGMKLKIPGKVTVPAVSAPVAAAKSAPVRSAYTGATKEYVVKSGDTLGGIAYSHGINIRQLKTLNGLKSDMLRIGQKLKVPAAKKPAKAAVKKEAKTIESKTVSAAPAAQPAAAPAPAAATGSAAPAAPAAQPAAATAAESAPAAAAETPAAPAAAETASANPTYVVQEGDDMTGVSIRWGVSASAIRELNNLGENDQLVPGQILKLPADAQQ